jgi:hypothetical protein
VLLALTISLLLLGILLLVLSIRGRRVGETRYCRECAFDLTGITTATSRDPSRCPECGTDTSAPRAVVLGSRRRSPIFISLAIVLLLVTLGAGAWTAASAKPDWNRHKPTWLLMLEATRLRGDVQAAAAAELAMRHAQSPLAPDQLAALVQPALRVQVAPIASRDWSRSPWFALLDAAFMADALNEEQERTYVTQALRTLEIDTPTRLLASREQVWADIRPQHAGFPRIVPAAPLVVGYSLSEARLDGEEMLVHSPESSGTGHAQATSYSMDGPGSYTWKGRRLAASSDAPALAPWRPPLGKHEIALRWRVFATLEPLDQIESAAPVDLQAFPHQWEATLTAPFEAFERPEDMVRLVTAGDGEPIDHKFIEVSIEVWPGEAPADPRTTSSPFNLIVSFGRGSRDAAEPWIVGSLEVRPAASGAAAVNSDRGGARSVRAESLLVLQTPEPGSTAWESATVPAPHWLERALTRVDIAIVPDIRHAADLQRLDAIWGEEIVMEDVELDWSAVDATER